MCKLFTKWYQRSFDEAPILTRRVAASTPNARNLFVLRPKTGILLITVAAQGMWQITWTALERDKILINHAKSTDSHRKLFHHLQKTIFITRVSEKLESTTKPASLVVSGRGRTIQEENLHHITHKVKPFVGTYQLFFF